MIESGFAIFFLLALIVPAVALAQLFRAQRDRIAAALRMELVPDEAPTVSAITQRPTAEVPWVAQRLLVGRSEEFAPVRYTGSSWPFAFMHERSRQLSLPFA